MMAILRGMLGMAAIVGVAVVFCEDRKAIRWRTVAAAFGLQALLAVVLLKIPGTRQVFFCSTSLPCSLSWWPWPNWSISACDGCRRSVNSR